MAGETQGGRPCSLFYLRLERAGGSHGFEVEFERGINQQELTCERLIIATPANVASSLVASLSAEISSLLDEIDYPPLSIVSLAYDESTISTPLDGFGFLVPPSEGLNILGCVWNTSLFKDRAPRGKALITVFIGGARNRAVAQAADAEMVSIVHSDLQKVMGISSDPQVVAITRYERSIPQYNLGHYARVQKIERLLSDLSGLTLIGNYLHGVSTGDCIKEADRLAKEAAQSMSCGETEPPSHDFR